MFRNFGLSIHIVLGMLPAAMDNRASAQKLTDVTFSLDFIVLGRHAP